MADDNFILKNPVLKPDEDFAGLRSQGLIYLQNIGSNLWTDYNEHDPGITILEALCYAISELGYRTSLPMEDLLTSTDGTIPSSQPFFTAKKILTQSPLTLDDYRKILIDLPGVQNAWLYFCKNSANSLSGEPSLYADCENSVLTYSPNYPGEKPVYLKGLYNVLLDLDTDPQSGDLNNGTIEIDSYSTIPGKTGPVGFSINFPSWDDPLADPVLLTIPIPAPADVFNINPFVNTAAGTIALSFIIGSASIPVYTITGAFTTESMPPGITIQHFLSENQAAASTQIIINYLKKIQQANNIVKTATQTLLKHRNLCEDFVSIQTIEDENIGFCFDVDVMPGADVNTILGNIYFVIENYLNPPVNFYLLSEMLTKGYTVDEIFDGPKLKHGFIDTAELEASRLISAIYASELVSLIMGITGVLGVRNFLMSAYNGTTPVTGQANQPWCLSVENWHKPVFSAENTSVKFYKNLLPSQADTETAGQLFDQLLSQQQGNKLTSTADDIKVPAGTYFPLDKYSSVQYLFPRTYVLGANALASSETDARKAQAKQLKAYLLFYDQLLADFLSQLKNAGSLFSTDKIIQTYYAQFVNGFNDADSIYLKDPSTNQYAFNEKVIKQQNSTTSPANDWQWLYESDETFIIRRNNFLDHLMARFSESFSDYVFLMYSLDNSTQQETAIDPVDLITSKIEFLKDYPRMSYDRAKGYDYCPTDTNFTIENKKLWNTNNVSGLEEKLCLLGGFADPASPAVKSYTRRFLECIGSDGAKLEITVTESGGNNIYAYTLSYELSGNKTLKSTATLTSIKDLCKDIITNLTSASLINNISVEGMYLIEHILLRPRDTSFSPATVCLDKNCDSCADEDPYSFRMSVVIPYWPAHFSLEFRDYFENLARTEAPAHCMLKVCWVDQTMMLQFEILYCIWIQAMALYYSDNSSSNLTFFTDANNNLLSALESLYSVYPVAVLHNCKESSPENNPVVLGKTTLGTINP